VTETCTPSPFRTSVASRCSAAWRPALLVAEQLPFLSMSTGQVFTDARTVLLGGALVCLVGVLDDLYELDALMKLAGQLLAAAVIAYLGVQLLWLPLPDGGASAWTRRSRHCSPSS
jgi:UDP-N-acetylmuramyl pentapeptide phosphotransferase/UDP-N-acetylglucosamine-1-phosphate transferase